MSNSLVEKKLQHVNKGPAISVAGRPVWFVGGPDAGLVRNVPETAGDLVKAGDFVYRIDVYRFPKGPNLFIGMDANLPPWEVFRSLWAEYSPAAQIRRQT